MANLFKKEEILTEKDWDEIDKHGVAHYNEDYGRFIPI